MRSVTALALLLACSSPSPHRCPMASAGNGPDAAAPDPVAECLERARASLAEVTPFEPLEARLESGPFACPVSVPSAFEAFEGPWEGRWGGRETRHLWCTREPGVQRVVLEIDGARQRGVNVAHAGQLCGIVLEPDGSERVHVGRWRQHRGQRVLEWQTPRRRYLERVEPRPTGSLHLIQELIGGELGTFTVYTRPERRGADLSPPQW